MTSPKLKPHAERAHGRMSPSTFARIVACKGSYNACYDLKPVPESSYAKEGTEAHEWCEYMLRNGKRDAREHIGQTIDARVGRTKMTAQTADYLNVYLDHVYGLLDGSPITELYVESRFSLARWFGNDDGDGTGDAVVYDVEAQHVHVNDLKFGAGVGVEAVGNIQLRQYGLGAVEMFKDRGVKNVTIWIVQPRFPGEAIKSWTLSRADLFDWSETMVETIEEARKPGAPRCAGPQCRWCPAAYWQTCDTLKNKALAAAAEGFEAANLATDEATPADPRTMGSEELGQRLREVATLMVYVKVLHEFATDEAKAGRMPSGFKWVRTKGHRNWTEDPLEVAMAILAEDPAAKPFVKELKTPAVIEKEIGKAKMKALAPLTKQSRGFAMAPESDRRPAVQYSHNDSEGFTAEAATQE